MSRCMRTISLSAAMLLAGCVTQGTYDMLKGEHDSTLEELANKNKALEAANKKIDGLVDQGKSLEAALAEEKEKLKDLEERLNRSIAEAASRAKDASKLKADVQQ